MAFLLFAFRKLSLKRNISRKELRLTQIDNRIMNLQEQQATMAQAKTAAQNSLSIFFKSNLALASNAYQMKTNEIYSNLDGFKSDYDKILKDNNGDTKADAVKVAEAKFNEAQSTGNKLYANIYADYQRVQQSLNMASQAMGSIFTTSDQISGARLHAEETLLATEKGSIESSLKVLNEEYKETCSSENEAAKDVVAKFGHNG